MNVVSEWKFAAEGKAETQLQAAENALKLLHNTMRMHGFVPEGDWEVLHQSDYAVMITQNSVAEPGDWPAFFGSSTGKDTQEEAVAEAAREAIAQVVAAGMHCRYRYLPMPDIDEDGKWSAVVQQRAMPSDTTV